MNTFKATCLAEWRVLLLAVGFFTRIPVPSQARFQESDLNAATKYFPLVGLLVGLVGAMVFIVSQFLFPQHIAVLLSMASTLLLTGAFHEDGLADTADGLGGGWEREKILTIMQDSRLGTYGAIALLMALLSKYALLTELEASTVPLALVTGHGISRLAAVWMMVGLPYAKPTGKAKPLSTQISQRELVLANVIGLLPWLVFMGLLWVNEQSLYVLLAWLSFTLLPMLLVWAWWRTKLAKWIQGYTGDTLGATQQLTELAFYLGVLGWSVY